MTEEGKNILLVEDEKSIRDAVQAYLEHEKYSVTPAEDGVIALERFGREEFDLIVLDLMLPRLSGEEVCNKIRETSTVPIIVLTAKGTVEDKVVGLELGADDYLVKPFSPRELVARVRALLRRAGSSEESQSIDLGDIVIDVSGHKVFEKGSQIDMTASEYKLLVTLAKQPGRVFTRSELVRKVLGYDFEGYERSIDSHIKNLRAKLGEDPKNPKWLFTVHGIGYRFELGASDDSPHG
ncbi:MAG: response regulator transcription factor [Coriobacteriales bacterium]|jgi:DNA-binding response OmpR family regulator|nr:response regulator transcription factor [Coriobacteriales bacterium]